MNLIIHFLVAVISISISNTLAATSYSKVFVEREVHPAPVEYFQYGAPYTSLLSPRLAEINTLPAVSLPPCGSPCLLSGQAAPLAPLNRNTVLAYQPPIPNVPIAVAPANEDASGYQYSYVVYDENTGDHKAQRELSDGGVVRGEYSFLQPDGYVREVQYVADDIKGFNAVVKNFLPLKKEVVADSSPPCPEIKLENLKEAPKEETTPEKVDPEPEAPAEDNNDIKVTEDSEKPDDNTIVEINVEVTTPTPETVESIEEAQEIPSETTNSDESSEPSKDTTESPDVPIDTPAEPSDETPPEEVKVPEDIPTEEPKDTTETPVEVITEPAPVEIQDIATPETEILVPYNDILRCIQAAINRANVMPAALRDEPSPLTYIILNKPC